MKDVSVYIGSVDDEVVSIPLTSPAYSAASVNELVSNNPTVFSLVTNPNGQTDLAFQIPNGPSDPTFIVCDFKQASNSNGYSLTSVDYVGGQPKTRCPQCP